MSTTLHMRISCCMGLGPEQQHNECLTASTATTYSSALLEKVFLQKDKLLGPSDSKEVNFRKLSKDERANMQEAMAREASEVLRSQALRAAREKFDEQTMRDRIIPMRWLLTWKPLSELADQPVGSQPPLPVGGSGRRYRLQDR